MRPPYDPYPDLYKEAREANFNALDARFSRTLPGMMLKAIEDRDTQELEKLEDVIRFMLGCFKGVNRSTEDSLVNIQLSFLEGAASALLEISGLILIRPVYEKMHKEVVEKTYPYQTTVYFDGTDSTQAYAWLSSLNGVGLVVPATTFTFEFSFVVYHLDKKLRDEFKDFPPSRNSAYVRQENRKG